MTGNIAGRDVITININGREVTIPFQIPAPAEHFTDRTEALVQLLADLQPGRVVTLCGPGGMGKTALAAQALHQLELDRFPHGIIWHSFYNQPQAVLALESIARALGEEPKPTPRDAALRALANKQVLLFLDGTEDAEDLGVVLGVRGHRCGALVTSRKSEDAPDEWLELHPLEQDHAIGLLQAWGKQQAADKVAALAICQFVGGLPLAIRLVGRYLAQRKQEAATYLAWLQAQPLRALDQGQRREQSVPLLLERSLQQVSEPARQVMALIGQLALSPFTSAVVMASFDLPIFEAEDLLGELVNYGLLLRKGEWYEVSHALIHTYARERLTIETDTFSRLVTYYIELAETESQNKATGFRRLDKERIHLKRLLENCMKRQEWATAKQLAWAMDTYFFIGGYAIDWSEVAHQALIAARNLGDRQDEGTFLNKLGVSAAYLGQVSQAIDYHKQALAIAREINNRHLEGENLGNLGLAYRDLGQVDKAIEFFQQALLIAREIGNRKMEGQVMGNLGVTYRDLGKVDKAIEFHEQALLIARDIGDRRGEGGSLGNLGIAYRNLGQVDKAIEFHKQALLISREIGDRRGEGADLGNLGIAYHELGQVEKARQYFTQAIAIFEAINSPDAAPTRRLLQELDAAPKKKWWQFWKQK